MGDSDKDKIEGMTAESGTAAKLGTAAKSDTASVDIGLHETAAEDEYGQLSFGFAAPKTRSNTTARRPISRTQHADNTGCTVNMNNVVNVNNVVNANNVDNIDSDDSIDSAGNRNSTADNANNANDADVKDNEYEQLSFDFGKSRSSTDAEVDIIKPEPDNESEIRETAETKQEPEIKADEAKQEPEIEADIEPEPEIAVEPSVDAEPEPETAVESSADAEPESEITVKLPADAEPETVSVQETEIKSDEATNESTASAQTGKSHHIFSKLLIGAAALTAAAYCGGIYYFNSHFLPNTYAGGVDISYLDAAEAEQKLQSDFVYDSVVLKGRDGEETLDLSDAGTIKTFSDTKDAINAQEKSTWFKAFFDTNHDSNITLSVSCDEDKLEAKLSELAILNPDNITMPTDAYPRLNTDTNLYEVEAETEGNNINADALKEAVHNALDNGDRLVDLEGAGVYTQPTMRADSSLLAGQIAWMNAINAAGATFDLDAGVVIPVNGELVGALVGDDGMADEEAVRNYVNGLAATYNTVSPDKQRSFINHNNVEKIINTSYGWQLNEDKTYPLLFELINKVITDTTVINTVGGNTETADTAGNEAVFNPADYAIKAVWKSTAAKHEENDIGNTYVEIDMGEQNVYIYADGNCVLTTPCVTGRMTKGRITPEGIYQIQYKQKSRYLTGRNPDGSISYRSFVNYWMPFNRGIGLHDATWRRQFGGTYYVQGGSHGCINLPLDMAKQIYDIVYTGMPVVCYY